MMGDGDLLSGPGHVFSPNKSGNPTAGKKWLENG